MSNYDAVRKMFKLRPFANQHNFHFSTRTTRDKLSHNVFLMLQETNKFREHQARELLIELLEKQLLQRQTLLEELQEGMQHIDSILPEDELRALEKAEEEKANAMQVEE